MMQLITETAKRQINTFKTKVKVFFYCQSFNKFINTINSNTKVEHELTILGVCFNLIGIRIKKNL